MQSWFIWKGKNSREMGLWVKKLPGETRAEERVTLIQVPGRSGHLTMLEGENVYDSQLKECTVITRRDSNFDLLSDWLNGEDDVIFSSSPNRAYTARIFGAVTFDNISNDLCQSKIPFYCQPLKKQAPKEPDIVVAQATASATLYNPGTVPSNPLVKLEAQLGSLSIAGTTMTFSCPAFSTSKDYAIGDCVTNNSLWARFKAYHSAGDWDANEVELVNGLIIDCEAKMASVATVTGVYPFTGLFSGEFPTIPVGTSTVTNSNGADITIEPRWRWR